MQIGSFGVQGAWEIGLTLNPEPNMNIAGKGCSPAGRVMAQSLKPEPSPMISAYKGCRSARRVWHSRKQPGKTQGKRHTSRNPQTLSCAGLAGGAAWEEDQWQALQIGSLNLSAVKPCDRCKVAPSHGPAVKWKLKTLQPLGCQALRPVQGSSSAWLSAVWVYASGCRVSGSVSAVKPCDRCRAAPSHSPPAGMKLGTLQAVSCQALPPVQKPCNRCKVAPLHGPPVDISQSGRPEAWLETLASNPIGPP